MADTETPTDPTIIASQPGAAAPAAFDPSALPPEAVAWIEAEKRKASDAAAAAARKAAEAKAKPATHSTPAAPPANPPAADDVTAILAMRDAFDDAVGDLPIKSTQKALMREAVMRDRPADVPGYVARFAERAGWNTAAPSAPSSTASTSPAPVSQPAPAVPSTLRAPPPPTPVVTDSTPILSMSPGDREALVQRIGVDEYVKRLNPELVKARVRLTP